MHLAVELLTLCCRLLWYNANLQRRSGASEEEGAALTLAVAAQPAESWVLGGFDAAVALLKVGNSVLVKDAS